ncbi:MAG: hypothetical protein LBT26_02180 [Clostridiales Family XIII bacterium]|jgi:L-ascorbate metabolism protein UlaG (beta-lactamase superfamily)|nr:hypothetical protein [Clostridiales Family XIII bacterium]
MDKNSVRITSLANAGLLVQYRDVTLMVDALQNETLYYAPLPERIFDEMLRGDGMFNKVDHVLYTHGHPDHFTAAMNCSWLARHSAASLTVPKHFAADYPDFCRNAVRKCDDVWWLDLPPGGQGQKSLGDGVSLTAFRTPHMGGKRFADAVHYCFRLDLGGTGVLITADCEYDRESYGRMAAAGPADAVFINPLFLHKDEGRAILSDILKPARAFVYHMPFDGADPNGYRRMMARDVERYRANLPPTVVLQEAMRQVTIP